MTLRLKVWTSARQALAEGSLWAAGALLLEGFSRTLLLEREGRFGLESSLTLLGIATALQVACALFVAPARAVLGLPWKVRLGLFALWFGTACGLGMAPVAQALTAGEWIRRQSYAGALRWGFLACAVGFAVALPFVYLTRRAERPRVRVTVALALALCAQALHVRMYPAQYEPLHLALWVGAALLLALTIHTVSSAWWEPTRRRLWLGGSCWLAMLALSATTLPPGPRQAATLAYGSTRTELLFGRLFPRQSDDYISQYLSDLDLSIPLAAPVQAPRGLLRLPDDTNVLLIVVDTLRADTLEPTRSQGLSTRFRGQETPFLDGLMRRSSRFERAYTQGTMTHLSMPPLFRSREPYEPHRARGLPLAKLMKKLGRTPYAVVPHYFKERREKGIRDLLSGFEEVSVYDKKDQNAEQGMVNAMLERAQNQRFFAWVHYYAMHFPGWEGKALTANVAAWPDNYRRPLRWVDTQIEALFRTLERLQLDERTMVVLTADHGEGLMDTGNPTHGAALGEEVVRAPLLFYIPGRTPRLIKETVGNIDIVPTLVDLLGGAAEEDHDGQSLVPLLVGANAPWQRRYASVARDLKKISLTRKSQKHLFDRAANLHFHFDLAHDPREDENLFDGGKPEHRALLHELIEAVPTYLLDKKDKRWQPLLHARIAEVRGDRPPQALFTLLELMQASHSKQSQDAAARWFAEASDERVRVAILRALYPEDEARFAKLLEAHLAKLGKVRGQAFADELTGYAAEKAARKALAQIR